MKEGNTNFGEGINLRLPGGEVTVWPKRIGIWEQISKEVSFEARMLLTVIDYIRGDSLEKIRQRSHRLTLSTFYQPVIPEELWQYKIRTTREIQMRKQLSNPRRG